MKASLRIFRVFGIDVKVHVSFVLVVAYFAYLWGAVYEPGGWGGALYGAVLVILLFGLVTMHELTHSRVAQHFGVQVKDITLLPIGGVAQMTEIPKEPRKEFLIAVAGPLSNLVLGAVMVIGALFIYAPGELATLTGFYQLLVEPSLKGAYLYLTLVNITLALFNLLPAFPLDGGRVLRAALALKVGEPRATRIATKVGQFVALGLGLWGLLGGGILVLLVAVFIFFAAASEAQSEEVARVLGALTVGQAVNTGVEHARPDQVVGELAARLFHTYQEDFLVINETGELVGVLTRDRLIDALSRHGRFYPVASAMRRDVPTVSADDSLLDAYSRMRSAGIRALPVVENGRLIGMLSMEDISEIYSLLAAAGPELANQVPAQRARPRSTARTEP